jgi:prolyl-tRNA synthetase
MRWSKAHLFTMKDAPNDAEIPSHKLMARAGMIKKVAPGIYTYGNLALRALRKFESIIRQELDSRGCQEVLMPMVQPAELWQETNRWKEMGDGLLKFKNRNGHDFCLGATHEEVITDYVRKDVKSYRDLPANLYQIQTKYRDEIRPQVWVDAWPRIYHERRVQLRHRRGGGAEELRSDVRRVQGDFQSLRASVPNC